MNKIITLTMLAFVTGFAGCRSVPRQSVLSYFRLNENKIVFVVHNNSDNNLTITGMSGGVTYHKTEYVDGEEIVEEDSTKMMSMIPGRFEMAIKGGLTIPPKGKHAFNIQGYRPLRENESASIHAVLKPLDLQIIGRLEIIKSNEVSSLDAFSAPLQKSKRLLCWEGKKI